jgi:hypothetical protein
LNWEKPVTNTSKYFADIDGDGLVDFLDADKNGKVLFNRLNDPTVNGGFTSESETKDTIWVGECRTDYILNDGYIDEKIFYKTTYDTIWFDCNYHTNGKGCKIPCIYNDSRKKYYDYFIQNCDICAGVEWTDEIYCSHGTSYVVPGGQIYDEHCFYSNREIFESHLEHDTVSLYIQKDDVGYGGCKYFHVIEKTECIIEPIYQPNIESVRCWIAPESGTVSISGKATLTDSLDGVNFARLRQEYGGFDGVRASIQHNYYSYDFLYNRNKFLKREVVALNHDSIDMTVDNAVSVQKGDRLFFRIESMTRRTLDVVNWNPVIRYTSLANTIPGENINSIDYNNDSIYVFKAAEDFIEIGRASCRERV